MFDFFWRVRNSEKYIEYLLGRRRELIDKYVTEMVRADKLEMQLTELMKDIDGLYYLSEIKKLLDKIQ